MVHADFKPSNILISADGHAIVADFGFVKQAGDGITKGRGGTASFMPPERLLDGWDTDNIITEKTDIYAFGITIFQVWTLLPPYGAATQSTSEEQNQLFEDIALKEFRPDMYYKMHHPELKPLLNMPEELLNLMKDCWATDPNLRPESFSVICDVLEDLVTATSGTESLTEVDRIKVALEPLASVAQNAGSEIQYALASMFAGKIKGFPQDLLKAIEWYQKAADQGHTEAQNDLGFYFYIGFPGAGIPKDSRKAAELWERAASKGHVDACHSLGHMYDEGD
ncbi:Receptor-interacting serine/threonine-protein kinase 4, partial [Gonapodya sp. JEL0774]